MRKWMPAVLIGVASIASLLLLPRLPELVEPNLDALLPFSTTTGETASRWWLAFGMPAAALGVWLLFLALNLSNVPIPALVSSMALISILQALPISFSGVGVRDAVLIAVLASYGYGPDKALSLSALFLLVNIEHLLIGFLVSLRHPLGSTPRAEGQQESARPRAENQSTINQ